MGVSRSGGVQLLKTILLAINQWSVVELVFQIHALVEQSQAHRLLATPLAASISTTTDSFNILHGVWLVTAGEGTLRQVSECWTFITGYCTLSYGLWWLRIAQTRHHVFLLLMCAHLVLCIGLITDCPAHFQGVWLWHDSLRLGWIHFIRWLRQVSELESDLLQELLCVLSYWWDQLSDQVKVIDDRLILDSIRRDFKSESSCGVSRWYIWLLVHVWTMFWIIMRWRSHSVWIVLAVILVIFEIFEFL